MSATGTKDAEIRFQVNGQEARVAGPPMKRLLDVLRQDLGLCGTKEGCGEGECGACAVRIDGVLVNSCLVPVAQVQGAAVQTIEGVARGAALHEIQEAFLRHGGAQCGICTPGMILAAVALLEENPRPSEAAVRAALAQMSGAGGDGVGEWLVLPLPVDTVGTVLI